MKLPSKQQSGFTLIELLVVISILTIVIALVVPRLRLINKDRNIRETARVVGSVFSAARDRAIAEGSSGVIIERNLNFLSRTTAGNRVYFAGTRMYQMRALPPYTGDGNNSMCTVTAITNNDGDPIELHALIPRPFEEIEDVLAINDFIRFNNTRARYRILNILPGPGGLSQNVVPLVLAFDDDNVPGNALNPNLLLPDFVTNVVAPPIDTQVPFSIERQPRRIQSSVVDLPGGYIIDLRYSGPFDTRTLPLVPGVFEAANPGIGMDDPDTYTVFGLALANNDNTGVNEAEAIPNREIQVHFNRKGAIDRVNFNGHSFLAGQSLYLFINEYNPSVITPTSTVEETAVTLLTNPDSLWLTVGLNGGMNIGYNAPPPIDPGHIDVMIANSRNISRTRTSASQ